MTTSLFRFIRIASTVVGKVSSHIVEFRLVLVIWSLRGESIRATKDVEKSISSRAISPCFDSKHFEKGSVVYILKPLDVPDALSMELHRILSLVVPYLQPNGYSPD